MPKEALFADEIRKLSEVKRGVLEKFDEHKVQPTPAVQTALGRFDTFLDTAYLWMCQLQHFVEAGGEDVSDAEG